MELAATYLLFKESCTMYFDRSGLWRLSFLEKGCSRLNPGVIRVVVDMSVGR